MSENIQSSALPSLVEVAGLKANYEQLDPNLEVVKYNLDILNADQARANVLATVNAYNLQPQETAKV